MKTIAIIAILSAYVLVTTYLILKQTRKAKALKRLESHIAANKAKLARPHSVAARKGWQARKGRSA